MTLKKTLIIFSLIFLFCINAVAENKIYEFGPKTDNLILFFASRDKFNNDTHSTKALKAIIRTLQEMPLRQRVMIAISDNDTLDLPDFVPVKQYINTKKIITKAHEYKNIVTFILEDGDADNVKIIAGADKKTSPSWLVKDLYKSLKKENINIKFKSTYILLYRLGLLEEEPVFAEFLNESIPAIKISSNKDLTKVLVSLINKYKYNIPQDWDKHYTIKKPFGFYIISEKILIIMILSIMFFALFYVFMITFLFEKKKEVHIKDLFKLWKMPILFFIINCISFYIGEYFTQFIFYIRLGSSSAIDTFPIAAIILKFSFALFLSTSFVLLNRFTKLPQNTFIYGYLTSLVYFFNIFIFSGFDVSYSLLFLELYILSFLSFQIKNSYSQILFFLLNLALLFHYFNPIFSMPNKIIKSIFFANNFIAASFFIPYELMLIRLVLRMHRDKLKVKINKITVLISFAVIAIISIGFIIIAPTFAKQKEEYKIFEIINETNNEENTNKKNTKLNDLKVDDFFTVSASSKNYLERSISKILVNTKIKAAIISVLVSQDNGFPVFESNLEFKTDAHGELVKFLSPINIEDAFSIRFSSEKDSKLNITIVAWYEEAPTNDSIKDITIKNNKTLFKVVKSLTLKAKKEESD